MCADFQVIHGSPMNNSISKQLYSFPKSNRFSPDKGPLCKSSFYEIKRGAFGNRATTFGYGNKMDLVKKDPGPAVGKYDLESEFLKNREKRKGYSFMKDSKGSVLVNPERSATIPGPGTYEQLKSKNTSKFADLSYTIRSRFADPLQKRKTANLGPGQYETIPSLTVNGTYFISKYANSGCGKIGRAERKSIAERSLTPGPGKYEGQSSLGMNNTGVYFYSKFRNMESGKFPKSNRPPLADTKAVPGPGSYDPFSEFANINKPWSRASTAGK